MQRGTGEAGERGSRGPRDGALWLCRLLCWGHCLHIRGRTRGQSSWSREDGEEGRRTCGQRAGSWDLGLKSGLRSHSELREECGQGLRRGPWRSGPALCCRRVRGWSVVGLGGGGRQWQWSPGQMAAFCTQFEGGTSPGHEARGGGVTQNDLGFPADQ